MKRAVLFLAFSLFLFGCKKDIFDYRYKFADEYVFQGSYYDWMINDTVAPTAISINSKGAINIDENNDSGLVISFDPSILNVWVSKSGELKYPGGSLVVGKIADDKITLEYEVDHINTGLNRRRKYTITGEED